MTFANKVIEWRHHIHKYPELSTKEFKTAEFVADKLEEFGLEVHRSIGGTGVVGVLNNGTSERSIGLRADMDALQIHEQNSFAGKANHTSSLRRSFLPASRRAKSPLRLHCAHQSSGRWPATGVRYPCGNRCRSCLLQKPWDAHGLRGYLVR